MRYNMKTYLRHECAVSGTLGYVLLVSQIFGVASLSFESARNSWLVHVSRAASIYGKSLILLLCALAASSLAWDIWLEAELSTHSYLASRTVLSVATVSLTSAVLLAEVYYGMERMHHLITSLGKIQKINEELNNYVPNKPFRRTERLIAMGSLVGGGIIVIEDYCILVYEISIKHGNYFKDGMYFAYYVETFILKVLTIQLVLIFRTILSSFNHLNNCLQDLLKQIHLKGIIDNFPRPAHVKIRRFCYLHYCLCDVIRQTNNSNGLVLVFLILSFLLHLIMTPYTFITKIFGSSADFYTSLTQVLWAIYHVMDLILIVEPCHQTHNQIDRTKQLVSRLMHRAEPANYALAAELELFYKHLMYNEVVYAPMKMFTLNRALITTMLGSMITYLVVVVEH